MAILKTCEAPNSPRHTKRLVERDGVWLEVDEYARTVIVESDKVTEASSAVEAAAGVAVGDPFSGPGGESNLLAFCMSVNSTKDARAPQKWVVELAYSTLYQPDDENDPFDQIFRYSKVERRVPLVKTRDAVPKPVVNSAGDQFDPLPETTQYDMQIDVQRLNALGSINLATMMSYFNAVNSAAVTWDNVTYPKLTLLFKGATIGRRKHNGTVYLDTNYTFLARSDAGMNAGESPHDEFLLDVGWQERSGGQYEKGNPIIHEVTNQPQPALLDGAGNLLAPAADPVFLHFNSHERKPFSLFPFT